MHIGIDVGGTNTDAVLMDGDTVLGSVKRATTEDVTGGIMAALAALAAAAPFEPAGIEAVMIGTTHFTNAVIEGRGLAPTAAIRLGLPAASGLPPLTGWPDRLRTAVGGHVHQCRGGHEFDGREISALDRDELARIADELGRLGVRSAAISSVFSPVNDEMERAAAQVLTERLPGLRVSLSHEIGRIGLLERENATIVNAALLEVAARTTLGFAGALKGAGLDAPLYLSQNDGTLVDAAFVQRYPVVTFAAGPTNSMRGAALLSGQDDCVVVDVGGTTTDVGVIAGGFPRPATTEVDVGGVRTNFRMPDVVSIGIGGGSLVTPGGAGGAVEVGPRSVGFRLAERARVFGGDTLTATDLAVAGGLAEVGDPALVAGLDRAVVRRGLARVAERVAATADMMRTSPEPVPVVLVGGGGVLLPDALPGFDKVLRPGNFAVANAIGAAIAQVGGEVDRIVALAGRSRAQALDDARDEAVGKAVRAGADPGTVRVVEVDEVPIAYLPGDSIRVRVKAVGDLRLGN